MNCIHDNNKVLKRYPEGILLECLSCHIVYLSQSQEDSDAMALYEDFYKSETGGRFSYGVEFVIRILRFIRAIRIFTIMSRAKSILDIGSGRGFTLYFLKKYFGYRKAIGTQLSKNALDYSRKKLGLEIYDKDLLDLPLEGEKFDIITMWHVLEHVKDPERYIERIYTLLKEGGNIVVEVPNYDSWTAGFTGKYWLGLDMKYHLTFFTPLTLSALLTKYNYRIKQIHTFSLEYSTFISVQSIVNLITGTKDVFFTWLQDGQFKVEIIFHLILFIILSPLCLLINLLLFFSRKGEILLIVAEKQEVK